MKGGTNGRTDGRTNESPPVFYRTSSPLGPLPKKRKKGRKEGRKEGRKKERKKKFEKNSRIRVTWSAPTPLRVSESETMTGVAFMEVVEDL